MFVLTRMTIITQNVEFSMAVKQLEARGEFVVATFTSAANAIAHLSNQAQHIVLIDFDTVDLAGADVIRQMRQQQKDIAVIVAPDSLATHLATEELQVQAYVNLPIPLRELTGVARQAVQDMMEQLPDTVIGDPVDRDPVNMDQFQVLFDDNPEGETVLSYSQPHSPIDIFEKLSAEEPPLPDFAESGTVRELMSKISGAPVRPSVFDDDNDDPSSPVSVSPLTPSKDAEPADPEDSRRIPAALILEQASDDSTPLEGFSMAKFLDNVQRQLADHERAILPLPTWTEEAVKYVREPDFLDEPQIDDSYTDLVAYSSSVTQPSQSHPIEDDPGNLLTEQIEPVKKSRPAQPDDFAEIEPERTREESPSSLPDVPAPSLTAMTEPDPLEQTTGTQAALPVEIADTANEIPYIQFDAHDPQVAQLAVTLTQVSLELTAEATLLIRDGDIIAYAGNMPTADVRALELEIGGNWHDQAHQASLRYIRLERTGTDYMLYTRRTAHDDILAMLFAGNLPLGHIRRQGKRLSDALAVIAEAPAVPEFDIQKIDPGISEDDAVSPEDVAPHRPHTYVWLIRDIRKPLSDQVRAGVQRGLELRLERSGWRIHAVDVRPDAVYVYADAPISTSARDHIHDLMLASTRFVQQVTPSADVTKLWADGYVVLSPGRDLAETDLQRFIQFARG